MLPADDPEEKSQKVARKHLTHFDALMAALYGPFRRLRLPREHLIARWLDSALLTPFVRHIRRPSET